MQVFKDGSIIVANDRGKLHARINPCGEPICTTPKGTHHSIELSEDGALWSWDAAFAVSVDPESGEVLKRIDLFEVHEENQDIDIDGIWRIDSVDASNWASDPMHANDVEPLPASLASALLMFEPGDLLISMRGLNLLSVVDPDTVKVKW